MIDSNTIQASTIQASTSPGQETTILTAPLIPELLAGQPDPAAFLNARAAYVRRPTPAVVVTQYGGRVYGQAPVNPQALASAEDTTRMYAHLVSLGMLQEVHIWENNPTPAHHVEWMGETRRLYQIGPFSAGNLLARYATTLATLADEQTRLEIAQAGLLNNE